MKVTLDLPIPSSGQVVSYKHADAEGGVYLWIRAIHAADPKSISVDPGFCTYQCAVQRGSVHSGEEPNEPIRPGKVLSMSFDDVHLHSELARDWKGDLIDCDSVANIDQREEKWCNEN